jgi:hypothetical protein
VGSVTMFKAVRGETWKHVPMPSVLMDREDA